MSSLSTNQLDIIKNFITNNQGIQRSNRYEVGIKFPSVLGNTENDTSYLVCYPSAVSFGARAINYVYDNLQGYNQGRAVPNSSKYVGGVVLTFIVTGNLLIMNKFYDWMDYLYGRKPESPYNFTTSYYMDSVQPCFMQLNFLDLNGNKNTFGKGTWKFNEVYPVECLPIELSAKNDTPLLFQVVLNYREITRSI